jgi:hypothetical protein
MAVNYRICTLRVKGRFNNVSLIHEHAPTEEKNEEINDKFYDDLETIIMKCPKNDVKVLLGDFNVMVGYEDQERAAVGKYGLHKDSNDKGLNSLD